MGIHSRVLFAARTPNSHNHSHVHYSLSKFTGEWFTNHSNQIHIFTPITRIVATKAWNGCANFVGACDFLAFTAGKPPYPYQVPRLMLASWPTSQWISAASVQIAVTNPSHREVDFLQCKSHCMNRWFWYHLQRRFTSWGAKTHRIADLCRAIRQT